MMRTLKVLDSTAISAALFEIESVDLLSRCCLNYDLITSPTVMAELAASTRSSAWNGYERLISVERVSDYDPTILAADLAKRYLSLDEGELTAYLVALRRSVITGDQVIFVTDDNAMRKNAKKVAQDHLVTDSLGSKFMVKDTGTVGLVLRMAERELLSDGEKVRIADDLDASTFRCDKQIIDKLRA